MMVRMPPRPMIFAVCRPLVRRASQAPAVLSGDRWVCAAGWGRVGGVDGVEGALAGRRRGRPGWPRTAAEIQHADGVGRVPLRHAVRGTWGAAPAPAPVRTRHARRVRLPV